MYVTKHAQTRMQQRGIRPEAVNAILNYGERRRYQGADVYFLDKGARNRLAISLGRKTYSKLERSLNSYLVVGDDGALVTAAHRLKRLKF